MDAAHLVQLFDDYDSMAEGVAAFLHAGFRDEGALIVATDSYRWEAIAHRLAARNLAVEIAIETGQLTVYEGRTTLNRLMRHGRPDADLFRSVISARVEEAAAGGKPLWIYGDMVDLLAEEGDFSGVHRLEELWNALAARQPFTLLCGYSAVNFGHPGTGAMLGQICQAHSQVRSDSKDPLSAFLVAAHGRRVPATPYELS